MENKVFFGADVTLAVYFGFYSCFFYSCGFAFLPNWIEGTLFDYFLPEAIDKTLLSNILPSGPVPSISSMFKLCCLINPLTKGVAKTYPDPDF